MVRMVRFLLVAAAVVPTAAHAHESRGRPPEAPAVRPSVRPVPHAPAPLWARHHDQAAFAMAEARELPGPARLDRNADRRHPGRTSGGPCMTGTPTAARVAAGWIQAGCVLAPPTPYDATAPPRGLAIA